MKIFKQNPNSDWFIVADMREFYNPYVNIIYTGVGKVNAAIATQYLLDHFEVTSLTNVGTAGAKNTIEKDQVYQCYDFIQRDFDTGNLDLDKVSVHINSTIPETWDKIKQYKGYVGTGDSFVKDMSTCEYEIVDMESFAIARTLLENHSMIKFTCLKYISDTEDSEDSEKDWEQALVKCNQAFNTYVEYLFTSKETKNNE